VLGYLGIANTKPVAGEAGRTEDLVWGLLRGAGQIFPAMLILWLAWSLSSMTAGESEVDGKTIGPFLGTGNYLAGLLQASGMPGWMLPTAVFVTSGFVAMSTGTSWGTMAILTPLSVELAVLAGGASAGGESGAVAAGGTLLVPVVGAVLAGSIFGDHCSPISDTTVLSSRASGCDHILHVRTQLPYAFAVGLITIVLGTLPSGFGFPAWASLLLGTVAVVAVVYIFGKTLTKIGSFPKNGIVP
jgi:Na+/H+ antiporter NhaC